MININDFLQDITIHLEQPNILISQSAYEKTTQMSLFDLKVSMDQTEKNLLFHTKQGELDSLGISQPLIKMKYTNSQTTDLEVQVKRPIKVDFSHTNFQKVMVLMVKVQKHIVKKSNITKKEIIAVNLGKKITVIKSYLKGIDNFDLTSSQLVIDLKVVDLYEFSMFCSSFKSKLKVYDRPEKIEFSTEVNSLTLRHKDKIALHPLTLQLKVRIVQPYWKKDPLVHINISSYYLRFDLHAVLVNQVLLMQQEFLKVLTLFKKEAKEIDKNPLRVIKEKLIPLPTQNAHFEELHRASIEHYQDDLRLDEYNFYWNFKNLL